MGNDWRIAIEKLGKNAVVGAVAVGIALLSQIDAQCPGATLTIAGVTIGIKTILDFLGNAIKHAGDA